MKTNGENNDNRYYPVRESWMIQNFLMNIEPR